MIGDVKPRISPDNWQNHRQTRIHMPLIDRSVARRVDMTSLQLFVAVCELGSIGKAAEREFIAASAVSKRLSELEAQLGAELLQRHSRGVSATPAGHSLLHHARSIMRSLEQMQAELAHRIEDVQRRDASLKDHYEQMVAGFSLLSRSGALGVVALHERSESFKEVLCTALRSAVQHCWIVGRTHKEMLGAEDEGKGWLVQDLEAFGDARMDDGPRHGGSSGSRCAALGRRWRGP